MKNLIAILAVGGVLSGVAMAMTGPARIDREVEEKIDARLHDLLVKARLERQSQ